MNYEVVIVGASIPGLCVANFLIKKGIKTLLVDLKNTKRIGESVSGNIFTDNTVMFLKNAFGIRIPAKFIEKKISSVSISSIGKKSIEVDISAYIINKKQFSSYLLGKALTNKNFDFLERHHVTGIIEEEKQFKAIKINNMNTGQKIEVSARIFVDASGPTAVLRRNLPTNRFIPKEINDFDRAVVYEEILNIDTDVNNTKLMFDPSNINSGYLWLLPKGKNQVRMGVGVSGMPKNIKKLFNDYKRQLVELTNTSVQSYASGIIPHRRPLNSLVFKNILIVGGAGCQINPLISGESCASIKGAYYASKTIVNALKTDLINTETLWAYNKEFMKDVGGRCAILECIRDFFTSLSTVTFDFILNKKIVPPKLIKKLGEGLRKRDIIFNSSGLLLKPRLLHKFVRLVEYSKKMKQLYDNYSDYSEFSNWKIKLNNQLKKVRKSFMV